MLISQWHYSISKRWCHCQKTKRRVPKSRGSGDDSSGERINGTWGKTIDGRETKVGAQSCDRRGKRFNHMRNESRGLIVWETIARAQSCERRKQWLNHVRESAGKKKYIEAIIVATREKSLSHLFGQYQAEEITICRH